MQKGEWIATKKVALHHTEIVQLSKVEADFLELKLSELNLCSWKKRYLPKDRVFDGEEWQILYQEKDNDPIKIHGKNRYPDNWKMFVAVLSMFFPSMLNEI